MGRARELGKGGIVRRRIEAESVALLPGGLECVRAGHIPGGLTANREFAECVVEYAAGIAEDRKTMLYDPQTAGGLLISVAAADAQRLTAELNRAGVPAVEIGEAIAPGKPLRGIA